jgi:two-component system chemotaxis response regulator CheB
MIQVLIVEDSLLQQAQLNRILSADPDITVLGTATNGEEALSFLAHQTPDVVTMDLMMPKMGGLETTRRIMERYPVPIVIVSAHWDPQEATSTFQAIDAGAVAGVAKPQGVGPDSDDWARRVHSLSVTPSFSWFAQIEDGF